jgi:phosphoglycolate phosphatase
MGAMTSNFIFDWSGTLIDDLDAVLLSANHVFSQARAPTMTREEFRGNFFLPVDEFYRRHAQALPFATVRRLYVEHYDRLAHRVVAQPGAEDALRELATRRHRLFLLSTVPLRHFQRQRGVVSGLDLLEGLYVDIQDKTSCLRQILTQHALDPASTFMVGDTAYDVACAQAAGIRSAAIANGYSPRSLLEPAAPTTIFRDLPELLARFST